MIDSIYDYAKLYYECGDYSTASQYLNLHNELVPSSDKVSTCKYAIGKKISICLQFLYFLLYLFLELFEWSLGQAGL